MTTGTPNPPTAATGGQALIEIKEIRVLRLQPGDTLIVTASRDLDLDAQTIDRIKATLRELFPDNESVVLSEGLDLSVMRDGETAR